MTAAASPLAREILDALDTGRRLDLPSQRPAGLSIDEAHAVADDLRALRIARGDRPVGRKIGFTNRAIWDEYRVWRPIWGDMWTSTVFEVLSGARVSIRHLAEPRIEPEIVIALAADLEPGMTTADIAARIDWYAHGYEIVQSIYPGWRFQAADCIANGGMHGLMLVGPRVPVEEATRAALPAALAAAEVTLLRDGTEMDRGTGANALDGPLEALRHLMEGLGSADGGPRLRAGEIVTTGTLTRAFPIEPGQTWTTRVAGIGLVGMDVTFD